MNAATERLIPIPSRMRTLRMWRGSPVPWFVEWFNGAPQFAVFDREKLVRAVVFSRCWICGEQVGRPRTFLMPVSSAITRTTCEPSSHHECATYAALACPYLVRTGEVACLWTTERWSPFRDPEAISGEWSIRIGEPREVEFYCQGRPATRTEVLEALERGRYTELEDRARLEGPEALAAFYGQRALMSKYLPEA